MEARAQRAALRGVRFLPDPRPRPSSGLTSFVDRFADTFLSDQSVLVLGRLDSSSFGVQRPRYSDPVLSYLSFLSNPRICLSSIHILNGVDRLYTHLVYKPVSLPFNAHAT